jgi:exonuclease VII small subunit
MAGLMKKKSSTLTSPESVKEIHEKAIMTLIVLTTNLISGDTPLENVLNFYQQPTVENVTRLLVRCKKMYDARVDVKKIILFII